MVAVGGSTRDPSMVAIEAILTGNGVAGVAGGVEASLA